MSSTLRDYLFHEEPGVALYCGDALDVLPLLPDVSIATVVGDPPYCSGGRTQQGARQVFEKSDRDDWFLGDNMGTDSYVWWLREIAGHLNRVAVVGAHMYLFTDWRQYTNVIVGCETKGWTLRSVVVWDKARGGAMGSFWRSNHEWVPVFTKGPPRPLPNSSFFNTWQGTKPQADEHPTVKPVALMKYLLSAGGGPAIDPWLGSRTTLEAAKALGIPVVGIEVEPRYCEIAVKRLRQEVLSLVAPDEARSAASRASAS